MNVFITGASSGIGAALVRRYAGRGDSVAAFARRRAPLEALVAEFPEGRVLAYEGDVRRVADLGAAAADFAGRVGDVDIVIANAGVSRGTLTEMAEDLPAFEAVFDVNVMGMVNTFHPFLARMRTAGRGRLVGVASIAGFRGLPGGSAYSASKAAAISYLESLRVELHGSGVRVVTICPGYVATPMTAGNPYRMPFLVPVGRAADSMIDAIDRGRRFHVFPWPMAIAGWLLRRLPRPLYDRLLVNGPRKPRQSTL